MKKKLILRIFLLTTAVLVAAACSTGETRVKKEVNMEPGAGSYKDSFFEKARLIMTKQEIDIYKHLPDKAAKEEFIKEFWKKRDPTPETEENENLEEFMERIEYANRWFKEGSKGRGWDTERGRILLQLGFPEERRWGEVSNTDRFGQLITSKREPMEVWTYIKYQMVLVFTDWDNSGKLRLSKIPTNFAFALEKAKFSLDLRDQSNLKRAFRFDVSYSKNQFVFTVPIKKLSFEEKNDRMSVDFDITIYVYKDSKKTDEVKFQKTFSMDKEELLLMKALQFSVPYTVSEKGKYYFDVVVEEKTSDSKYRDFEKYKI